MVRRSSMLLAICLIAQAAFLTATALPARACTCAGIGPGAADPSIDAVFFGTVLRFEHRPGPDHSPNPGSDDFDLGDPGRKIVAVFDVHSSTKGDVGNRVEVFAGFERIVGGCLYSFEDGRTYRVFGRWPEDGDTLRTSMCDRTHEISTSAAASAERLPQTGSLGWIIGGSGLGLLLLGAGLTVVARRFRQRSESVG